MGRGKGWGLLGLVGRAGLGVVGRVGWVGVGGLGWDLGGDTSQVPGIEKILLFELKKQFHV